MLEVGINYSRNGRRKYDYVVFMQLVRFSERAAELSPLLTHGGQCQVEIVRLHAHAFRSKV